MKNRAVLHLLLPLFSLLLAACGSGTSGSGNPGNSVTAASSCFSSSHAGSCHGGSLSPGTNMPIVAEWQKSVHFTSNAAGCVDCHETTSNHYCAGCHGGSSLPPVKNPDAAGKCGKCHGLNHPADRMMGSAPVHFGNVTSTNMNRYLNYERVSYVSGMYKGKCRECHNPHDTSTTFAYNRVWAKSAHADTSSGAYAGGSRRGILKLFGTDVPADKAFFYTNPSFNYAGTTDAARNAEALLAYQTYGNSNTLQIKNSATDPYFWMTFTPGCVRCHTTTGFINFVDSGFMSLKAVGDDPSKEVTACNACHVNSAGTAYGRSLRMVPPVKIYYNFSSSYSVLANPYAGSVKLQGADGTLTSFTDFGASNMCMVCHTGRASGRVLDLMAAKADAAGIDLYANTSIPSVHDFSGGGTLDRKIGYHFADPADPTRKLDYSERAEHEHVWMTGTPKSGPCIGCHHNTANRPDTHYSTAVELGTTFSAYSSNKFGYSATHMGSLQVADVTSRTCASCHGASRTPAYLNDKKQQFSAAYLVLKNCVARVVSSGNYKRIGTTSRDYVKTMGASFNSSYLANEPAAYVHSPLYSRRLIYDSIDWLRTNTGTNPINQTSVYDTIVWMTGSSAGSQRITLSAANLAIKFFYGASYSTTAAPPNKNARPS